MSPANSFVDFIWKISGKVLISAFQICLLLGFSNQYLTKKRKHKVPIIPKKSLPFIHIHHLPKSTYVYSKQVSSPSDATLSICCLKISNGDTSISVFIAFDEIHTWLFCIPCTTLCLCVPDFLTRSNIIDLIL